MVNLKDSQGTTALHWASSSGRLLTIAKLVKEYGADVNARDASGQTALHVAAGRGESEAVRILCRLGGQVNARDNDGLTPVERALVCQNNDTALFLVRECGARLNDLDPSSEGEGGGMGGGGGG